MRDSFNESFYKNLSTEELKKKIAQLERDEWFYHDSPSDSDFDVTHALLEDAREELERRKECTKLNNL